MNMQIFTNSAQQDSHPANLQIFATRRQAMKIATSPKGKRCGETHPAAKLTDREVELLRQLHEIDGWGYRRLSAKFEIAKSTVQRLCTYRNR